MRVLVVYDVSQNRARRRLSDLLGQYGVRVQRSAFEVDLERWEWKDLIGRIERIVGREKDRVALYKLPALPGEQVRWLGAGPLDVLPQERQRYFII